MGKQNTEYESVAISDNLQTNINFIKDIFKKDSILRTRQVRMNTGLGTGVDSALSTLTAWSTRLLSMIRWYSCSPAQNSPAARLAYDHIERFCLPASSSKPQA